MARVIAIKGPVLVEEVAFGNEPTVNIAVTEVDGCLALVLDVRDLGAGTGTDGGMEDEEVAVGEDDAAFEEGGVFAGLAVECAAHLCKGRQRLFACGKGRRKKTDGYRSAAGDAADVEQLR